MSSGFAIPGAATNSRLRSASSRRREHQARHQIKLSTVKHEFRGAFAFLEKTGAGFESRLRKLPWRDAAFCAELPRRGRPTPNPVKRTRFRAEIYTMPDTRLVRPIDFLRPIGAAHRQCSRAIDASTRCGGNPPLQRSPAAETSRFPCRPPRPTDQNC